MAKSSISADITAANSKMAQHIREREEREGLGIGRARVRDVAAENQGRPVSKGKSSRWSLSADFMSPSPMVDRPRTTTGSTSFHFSYTSISKQGSPTFNGTPVSTGSFSSPSPGADHEKYIGREGAAEYSMGADHAAYIERDGAIEMMDRTGEMSEGMERSLADMVNEVPSEEDAKLLGPEDVREGIPSIFTNISDNPFEREEYWRAVHRTEREPRKHQLLVDPSVNPTWWAQMEGWPDMNEAFRAHCLMEKARYRQWQRDEAKNPTEKQFVPKPFQEDAEIVGRALVGARKTPGWNEVDPPVTFKSGRGGRVQFRFVAELPHEVSAEDRALIVQNFCDHLATFSEGADGKPTGMMYTAVIHAPDAHNDRRNYHLHVIAHDRPAKWMPEHGAWDFEVAETFNHKGQDRVRYPYRQNKIGEIARKEKDAGAAYNDKAGQDFVPAMRKKYSEIANAVLNLRGIDRRLDPRRYVEMGIERTPTKHLGTSAAALESIGVATELGKENAAAIWNDAARAIERRAKDVDAALNTEQRGLVQLADDVQRTEPRNPALQTLRILVAERESLIENVADDRRLIMTFDHLEAKAKSRAIRTRQTCLQFLTDIQHGVADRTTNSSVKQIQNRWREAQNHIEAIDRDLAPQRPVLAAAARDVVAREERIKQIDALLVPIRAALENAAQQTREEREARQKRRDRAKDLGRRDDAERHRATAAAEAATAARGAATDQTRTGAADVGAAPRTNTDGATVGEGRAPRPTDQQLNANRENGNVTTNGDRAAIIRTGWVEFAPPESGPAGAGSLSSAADLAGLRDLSGLELVHDGDGSEVLLQRLPSVVLERQGGSGDVVRREGDRDPAADGQDGEGRGLTAGQTPPSQAASMQPIAIEGVPITAPTIDPASSPIATPAELATRSSDRVGDEVVPEGLTPLRPQTSSSVPATEDEPAVPIDGPIGGGVPAQSGDQAAPAGDVPSSAPTDVTTSGGTVADDQSGRTETPAEPAPKVDGRRKQEEATLFPLEVQRPPEKPGTVRAEYSTWNDLMGRISSERILVVQTTDGKGRPSYEVPSLDDQERAALKTDRFSTRTGARLAAIHQSQQREIDRLVRWIAKNGRDPDQLTIVDRRARVGDAPQSVHRLMRDWGIHPAVTQALREENDRRAALAREKAAREASRERSRDASRTQERVEVRDEAVERNERIGELQRRFPDPSGAHTMQVEELLKKLREDADRREIERAAEAVRQDAIAREDVHRHGLELSQAYNTILDEAGAGFGLGAGRGKRGGR